MVRVEKRKRHQRLRAIGARGMPRRPVIRPLPVGCDTREKAIGFRSTKPLRI